VQASEKAIFPSVSPFTVDCKEVSFLH
jgi:hypothetical protein